MSEQRFDTGAVRSGALAQYRFDLLHPVAMFQMARTLSEGAEKYGPHNYEQGMPVTDALNHALWHIFMYLSGDRSEAHLAHLGVNAIFAMVSEEMHPDLNGDLRGPGCQLTPMMITVLESMKEYLSERRKTNPVSDWTADELPEIQKWRLEREAWPEYTTELAKPEEPPTEVRQEATPASTACFLQYADRKSLRYGQVLTKEAHTLLSRRSKTGFLSCPPFYAEDSTGRLLTHTDACIFEQPEDAHVYRNTFIDHPETWAAVNVEELREKNIL